MPQITWTHWLFAAVLAVEGLQRIIEMVVSRRRQAERAQQGVTPVREFAWYVMVTLHALLFVLPPAEILLLDRPFLPWLAWPCLALYALAKVLRYWALSTLGKAWNARVVPPNHVVSEGPYQFIRHPNYLVVITELAVVPLIHTAWISALALSALNAAVLLARIKTEEAALFQIPGYREAMGNKARFLPGIF